jgi:hypothetical protein
MTAFRMLAPSPPDSFNPDPTDLKSGRSHELEKQHHLDGWFLAWYKKNGPIMI